MKKDGMKHDGMMKDGMKKDDGMKKNWAALSSPATNAKRLRKMAVAKHRPRGLRFPDAQWRIRTHPGIRRSGASPEW